MSKGVNMGKLLRRLQGCEVLTTPELEQLHDWLREVSYFFGHLDHHWIANYANRECDSIAKMLEARKEKSSKTVIVLGHDGNELARWKADSK